MIDLEYNEKKMLSVKIILRLDRMKYLDFIT